MNLDQKKIKVLNKKFHSSKPYEIMKESLNLFGDKIVYVSSFGTESVVILHMISQINKKLPIILLNTKFLFNQTIDYKNKLINLFKFENFLEIFPDTSDLKKYDPDNTLWQSDIEKCCNLRKVRPLDKALKNYDAWISGRKTYQGGERIDIEPFEFNNGKIVVNPLANFKRKNLLNYFKNYDLPQHPLLDEGYFSVGCTHCTHKSYDQNDPRSGRWVNQTKTECGIHYKKD
ncbi:MAG: phosphoadenylyl-sulfate reductase [Pseudomonadota bacterium]|nr:phosphoadenylyl-sulfate reductase [Pseudomonadota bacterium]